MRAIHGKKARGSRAYFDSRMKRAAQAYPLPPEFSPFRIQRTFHAPSTCCHTRRFPFRHSCGCSAHILWGVAVLYWHQLAALPAVTILAHRMLWSLLLLIGLLAATRRLPELVSALRSRREAPVWRSARRCFPSTGVSFSGA